jgi:tetratricopeptide (TPR) repeat protein
MREKPGRNDPCFCGSGKKYKKCCQNISDPPAAHFPAQQSADASAAMNIPAKGRTPTSAQMSSLAALYNAGHHAELERQARLLVQQYPDSGPAWKVLATSLHVQGKEPLPALQMAVKLLPGDAESHYNMGLSLQGLGRPEDAVASYRRALKIKPNHADAHFNLGNVLKDLGQLDDAVASYRRALRSRPDYADAHCNLGNALKDLGQPENAVASYLQALTFRPDDAETHYNLGIALKSLGRFEDAVTSYRLALKIKPDYTDAHLNLANTLRELEQNDAAEASYRRVLEIDPKCSDALAGLGDVGMVGGDMDGAEDLYRQVLANDVGNLYARMGLAKVSKVKAGDENLAALEAAKLAAHPSGLPDDDVIRLNFTLGKCYDDTGEYDKAFAHFLEGSRLKRATLDYDADKSARHFDSIMRVFDEATLARLRGSGDASQVPIFVLGMPRSGTTLTEQILASHPDVYGAGELQDLLAIAHRAVAEASYPENILKIDRAQLAAWGADYVCGLQKRAPHARHITDKMPANFYAIGLIHLMLPNAKIIHVNRNPIDTCLSCFMQLFNARNLAHTYDLAELGRHYVDYARLMEHWRRVLPAGAFLDVNYEEVVADLEAQARRMLEYCGLEWNDACINFHKHKRSIRTASVTQVRQPIYQSSVEKWRRYEHHLGPLLDALGDRVPIPA